MGAPMPYQSVWSGTTPPDGPASVGGFVVGFWFKIDAPGILRGFRHYLTAGEHGVFVAQLWADDMVTLLGSASSKAAMANRVEVANSWRSIWCHPRVPLVADTLYLVQVQFAGQGIWRHDGLLNEFDYVSGHFTVPFVNEAGTHGARYHEGFEYQDPADNPGNNLYAVDVLVEFAP
jgi:hypothetical protein